MDKNIPYPNIDAIHDKIRELMHEHGTTQTALGEVLGITQNAVSTKLKGHFQIQEYIMIADYYGISLDELCCCKPAERPSATLYPRDVCKMLAEIYDSDYGFEFESASEENGTRIYFASPSLDSCFPESNLASFNNYERGSINAFFEKMKRIADMREADRYAEAGFNDDMYETLLNEYLSAVDDSAGYAEGQLAFIKAMYKSGAKPIPFSVEEAGIKALSCQDHLRLKEASEQGLIELDDVSDMLPDPEEITAYKKKYPDAFPDSSGEVKSSKKKKREQD